MELLTIVITAVITENIIFYRTTGMCPFLGVSKKINSGISMGLAVTFVTVLASMVCWMLNTYVLAPLNYEYLQIIVFILVIACLVQLLDIVLKKFSPAIYHSMGIYLALITTNCAVLGTANDVIEFGYGALNTLVYSLSVGVGFMLALILMAGVRERMETANIPKFFKGFSITLIAAAIMAMAFLGLSGISFTNG